jgi:UrcA family protein
MQPTLRIAVTAKCRPWAMNGLLSTMNCRHEAFTCRPAEVAVAVRHWFQRRRALRSRGAFRPPRRCVRPAIVVVGQEALESLDCPREDGTGTFLIHLRSTLMNCSMKIFVITLFAVTFVHTVNAGTPSDGMIRRQSVVRFGDLNLSIERDAKTMLRRIDQAAIAACGGWHPFGLSDGLIRKDFEECHADAVAKAVVDLGAPLVTRVYTAANAADKG